MLTGIKGENMPESVIIYHDNCVDGFAAAWVAQRYFEGQAALCPSSYGEEPPYDFCEGKDVLVVDFSYPRQQVAQLEQVANDLTVIDHHKTAAAELAGLECAVFDMNRSGAGLTWDTLFKGFARPDFVNYIEDRDLWRFQLPDSKAVNAYIGTIPRVMDHYDDLEWTSVKTMVTLGHGAQAYLDYYAEQTMKLGCWLDLFKPGQPVWCVNCAPMGVSEVCDAALGLCVADTIACGWYIRESKMHCSLRSSGDIDVSEIAKRFGGGGHKHAAGFAIALAGGGPKLDIRGISDSYFVVMTLLGFTVPRLIFPTILDPTTPPPTEEPTNAA
jgi:hypothetical protein